MSIVLKPHAEVKDSGVEWLGEVPTHWSVRRLRNLVTRMRASNVDKLARSGHGVGHPIESAPT